MPVAVFLDESHPKHHPVLGVGGFVCDLADVLRLERGWREAKEAVRLSADEPVRYAMRWKDPALRLPLIERVPKLGVPILAVAALLEDFRPKTYEKQKAKRNEMYIYRRGFEYVLQRLPQRLYLEPGAPGPHLVFADRHDDFGCYEEEYAKGWAEGWPSLAYPIRPLREAGFFAAPAQVSRGPAMEVADLIASVASRWAAAMVARDRGKLVQDLGELEAGMRALLPLFPTRPWGTPSWRGYSLIAHADRRTGGEVIYEGVDRWLLALRDSGGNVAA